MVGLQQSTELRGSWCFAVGVELGKTGETSLSRLDATGADPDWAYEQVESASSSRGPEISRSARIAMLFLVEQVHAIAPIAARVGQARICRVVQFEKLACD